jgi:ethanolamine utilization protein EutA
VLLCLEQDMAKALGQALAVRLGPDARILCIDRVRLTEGSYLDVGEPVGPALPVVVKTLVLGR